MNFLASIAAWLVWNVIIFRIEKDKFDDEDKEFPLKTYAQKTWDNWLTSLLMIPVLLFLGYKGLAIHPMAVLGSEPLEWSDSYYLGAGFFTEAVMYGIKKWRGKQ